MFPQTTVNIGYVSKNEPLKKMGFETKELIAIIATPSMWSV